MILAGDQILLLLGLLRVFDPKYLSLPFNNTKIDQFAKYQLLNILIVRAIKPLSFIQEFPASGNTLVTSESPVHLIAVKIVKVSDSVTYTVSMRS